MSRLQDWKHEFSKHKKQIIIAFIILIIATFIYSYSGSYTTNRAKVQEVPDLILDHIPALGGPVLIFLYVWYFTIITSITYIYPIIFKPRRIHYAFGMVSIWILVRSIFISLTHLKTPTEAIDIPFPWLIKNFYFQNDLFFSGHTGLPFLAFLIYRKDSPKLAYFMLFSSILMGATVLLVHQHYSIDVFAAFFITYGVYKIGSKIFNGNE